jgi:hypothetical protein
MTLWLFLYQTPFRPSVRDEAGKFITDHGMTRLNMLNTRSAAIVRQIPVP